MSKVPEYRFPEQSRALAVLIIAMASLLYSSHLFAGPPHDAASEGDVALVNKLIAEGADINEYDSPVCAPLHWAAAKSRAAFASIVVGNRIGSAP